MAIEGQCLSSFDSIKSCLCLVLQTRVTHALNQAAAACFARAVLCLRGKTYPLPAARNVVSSLINFLAIIARTNLCHPKTFWENLMYASVLGECSAIDL